MLQINSINHKLKSLINVLRILYREGSHILNILNCKIIFQNQLIFANLIKVVVVVFFFF